MSRIAYVNGRYALQTDALVNVEDRGYQFADGVYEVIAVLDRRLVDLEPHLDRLERSLDGLRITLPCARRVIGLILNEVIRRNRVVQGFVYMQITRGVASRNHAFPERDILSSLVVTATRKGPPSDAYVEKGVSVITVPDSRWARPDIKSVSLLANVLAKQQAIEAGAYEAWFIDDEGQVTEGSSSNAWIVVDGQEVVTRPLGRDILAGITRQTLIEVARASNLRVTERPFSVDEVKSAQEAFLTSTTSFVMPVVAVDGSPIGEGEPGSVTLRLLGAYRRHLSPLNGE